MERFNRALTHVEARDIIGANKIKLISTVKECNHTETVYRVIILSSQDNKQVQCDICTKPADYWQWIRDHTAQIFITGLCEEHVPDA